MEKWAEIRRLKFAEKLSQCEIRRRTGAGRDTIRKAPASAEPPSYGPRPSRPSTLDPIREEIEAPLIADPRISAVRLREICGELGYEGSHRWTSPRPSAPQRRRRAAMAATALG